MTFAEAKNLVAPRITSEAAAEWVMLDTDWSIWVEYNIMAPAGVSASITTKFGERVSDWVEAQLEKKHMEDLLES